MLNVHNLPLDIFRYVVAAMCAGVACMIVWLLGRALSRWRQGATRVRVPVITIVLSLVSLLTAAVGAGIQLIHWARVDMPFAWYRSPLVFLVVLLVTVTLLQLINFIYPVGDGSSREDLDDQVEENL